MQVKLVSYSHGLMDPDELSAYGAWGCIREESSLELKEKDEGKRVERILENSAGRGHLSVLDQNHFFFVLKDVPRLLTFHLCFLQFASHLQQSMRFVKGKRIWSTDEKVAQKAFAFYEREVKNGTPKEDARFILPLGVLTNIQTGMNARELIHLYLRSDNKFIPSPVKSAVQKMIEEAKNVAPRLFKKRGFNYDSLFYYPAPTFFHNHKLFEGKDFEVARIVNFDWKRAIKGRDEVLLGLLKHNNNGLIKPLIIPLSLSALHQIIRHRTINLSIESIFHAIKNREIIIPESIKDKDGFESIAMEMLDAFKEVDDLSLIPHALKIRILLTIDMWNAFIAFSKRRCTKAQWEIRQIAWRLNEFFKMDGQPHCVLLGHCPERNGCGYLEKFKKGGDVIHLR